MMRGDLSGNSEEKPEHPKTCLFVSDVTLFWFLHTCLFIHLLDSSSENL